MLFGGARLGIEMSDAVRHTHAGRNAYHIHARLHF